MSIAYTQTIGCMKQIVSHPAPELSPYIEQYIFYENHHIKNSVYLQPIPNGWVELYLHDDQSLIYLVNQQKKIPIRNFFVGLQEFGAPVYIKPVPKKKRSKEPVSASVSKALSGYWATSKHSPIK